MQIIYRLHLDDTFMALLAVALLSAVALVTVSAAKSVHEAQARAIEHTFRQLTAAL